MATRIRLLFAVSVVMSALLVAWELRRKDPLIDLRYFRNPSFTAAVAIAICAFADLGAFLFLTSIYLQDVQGDSVIAAGLHMLPTAAGMAVCPFLAAWVTAKTRSARLPLLIGGLMLMLSTTLMSKFTDSTANADLLQTFGLFGIGMGLVNSQISVAAVAGMPASQAGLASGIASASRQVGQALGVAVAGSLLTAKAHGRLNPSFTLAIHSVWHLLFWSSCAAVIGGLMTTRARARHAKVHAKTGELLRLRPTGRLVQLKSPDPVQPVIPKEPAELESVWIPRLPKLDPPDKPDDHAPW